MSATTHDLIALEKRLWDEQAGQQEHQPLVAPHEETTAAYRQLVERVETYISEEDAQQDLENPQRNLNRLLSVAVKQDDCLTAAVLLRIARPQRRGAMLQQPLCAGVASEAMLEVLVDRGVDVDFPHANGGTALHTCETAEILSALVRRGADPCAVNRGRATTLHYAHSEQGARVLLDAIRERRPRDDEYLQFVNRMNSHGHKALHLAASKGRWEVIWWLLRSGATDEERRPDMGGHAWRRQLQLEGTTALDVTRTIFNLMLQQHQGSTLSNSAMAVTGKERWDTGRSGWRPSHVGDLHKKKSEDAGASGASGGETDDDGNVSGGGGGGGSNRRTSAQSRERRDVIRYGRVIELLETWKRIESEVRGYHQRQDARKTDERRLRELVNAEAEWQFGWRCQEALCRSPRLALVEKTGLPAELIDTIVTEYVGPFAGSPADSPDASYYDDIHNWETSVSRKLPPTNGLWDSASGAWDFATSGDRGGAVMAKAKTFAAVAGGLLVAAVCLIQVFGSGAVGGGDGDGAPVAF